MRRLILAGVAAAPVLAFAQTLPDAEILLPDQVITATRIPTLIERIPAGVTVIDRAAIEAHGYTSLPDALEAVPGLRVVPSGAMGGNASVFIRGTNSNHVLVLRDGVPVNDPADPGGLFNFGVDGIDDVERIEVVRGPMSSLYGSGAIGGVINLITKRGKGAPQASITAAYGLPRASRLGAGLSGSQGMFDYALHVDDRADVGSDNTPRRESVYTGSRNGYHASTGSLELGVTPVEGTRISGYLRGRTATFGLDDTAFPAFDSTRYRGRDDAVFGRLGVSSRMLDDRLETKLTVSHSINDRHYVQALEAADPNQASGDTRYHGARTTIAWDNTFHLPDGGIAADSAVLSGLQHAADTSRSALNTISGGFPYQAFVRASATSDAGHAGMQTTLFKRLTLTADGRGEGGSYGGAAATWRAGAVLAVPEVWSRVKASYGTAFRAPSLFDLFGVDNTGYVGNPRLKPERSIGGEAGFAIDIPAFGRKDAASLELTWFSNRINNLIQTVFNSSFTASSSQNVAHATSSGYEATLTLRPASWLEASASYTHTDTRNRDSGAALLRRPREQASLSLRATPLPGLTIAPEVVYTGPFQDFLYDDNGFPTAPGRARPGTIVNASVSYAVTPVLTAFLDGRNLTNSRFEPASGFQTPGTSFLAGIRSKF